MLSNSSIQNQNVINSNNISGSSSGSVLCNSLTLTDGTNITTFGPTDTTLNNLTVNGTSTFNGNETHNGRESFDIAPYFNAGYQIREFNNLTNFAQFYQSGQNLIIQPLPSNSKIKLSTCGATAGVTTNNLLVENGNQVGIQGQSGQGIDILNNQIYG